MKKLFFYVHHVSYMSWTAPSEIYVIGICWSRETMDMGSGCKLI